jgi:hypothetical protein
MALNPNWNQYNVAPIGDIIVVGHARALKGGITREAAINLIAWLSIAANAGPEEIADEIDKAHTETPELIHPTTTARQVGNQPQVAVQTGTRPAPVRGNVVRGAPLGGGVVGVTAQTQQHAGGVAQGGGLKGGPLAGPVTATTRPSPRFHGGEDGPIPIPGVGTVVPVPKESAQAPQPIRPVAARPPAMTRPPARRPMPVAMKTTPPVAAPAPPRAAEAKPAPSEEEAREGASEASTGPTVASVEAAALPLMATIDEETQAALDAGAASAIAELAEDGDTAHVATPEEVDTDALANRWRRNGAPNA